MNEAPGTAGVWIDGRVWTPDELTFREKREIRAQANAIALPGEEAGEIELVCAMVTVVKRRTDPAYTIEQALDLKAEDLEPPADVPAGDPTTGGGTGTPAFSSISA